MKLSASTIKKLQAASEARGPEPRLQSTDDHDQTATADPNAGPAMVLDKSVHAAGEPIADVPQDQEQAAADPNEGAGTAQAETGDTEQAAGCRTPPAVLDKSVHEAGASFAEDPQAGEQAADPIAGAGTAPTKSGEFYAQLPLCSL